METLVFFVAIAAIQVIASYVKQKKDKAATAKKAQQRASQPAQRSTPMERPVAAPSRPAPPPPETAPMPDPLKEIMRQLGVPEAHPPTTPPPPAPARETEVVLERSRADEVEERAAQRFEEQKAPKAASKPKSAPKPIAVDHVAVAAAAVHTGDLGLSIEDTARFEAAARARSGAQDLPKAADLRKGIVWATILQEPRFRKPWSPAYR